MNNNNHKKQSNYSLDWRRDRVIELYSEGRNQSQISQILKIGQPTVHRDLRYQKQQCRNKAKTYLDEYLLFEHNVCQVGINSILRRTWNIINDSRSSEKAVFQALSLAKDCCVIKNNLLGDKTIIERAIDFVSSHSELQQQIDLQKENEESYRQNGLLMRGDPMSQAKF